MRCVLFYSGVESFNYFTNQIATELEGRGVEYFILNLSDYSGTGEHSLSALSTFLSSRADMAISFDGLGIKEDLFIELWDSMGTLAVNILMDHPLRFHPTMRKHPRNYVQFCCDRNHVEYVKKYFGQDVSRVEFMPHAGTDMGRPNIDGYRERPYDVLFSGTFYEPDSYLRKIDQDFANNTLLKEFYYNLSDYMIANTSVTTEQAVLDMVSRMNLAFEEEQIRTLFRCAEPMDWMARMYWRMQVVQTIADAGIDIWLLGRGWENHPAATFPNVHIINDRVPFADTLPAMAKAKMNLNVMPWFKDGTHDRIFNILLQGSLPLTDSSQWLLENFRDGKNIAFYSLEKIQEIPQRIQYFLNYPDEAERVIESGYEIVKQNFVWKNIVDQILTESIK